MNQIFTITLNPSLDKTTSVKSLQPDKKLRCAAPVYEAGGGGINVARAVTRLGGAATPLYFAGGPSGHRLTELLKKEGVGGIPVEISGETRENLNISDEGNQRQYRFIMPGPEVNAGECEALLQALSTNMKGAAYVVISGSMPAGIPAAFFGQLAGAARKANAKLIVDTSGESLKQALQTGVYLAKPNIGELAALTGKEQLLEEDAVAAARQVINDGGSQVIIVSMGEAGALVVSSDISEKISAPVVKRVSTVGAGDSMVAGVVLGLERGLELKEAVRFGVACGTAATMNPGTALCKKEDAERLFAEKTAR